LPNTESDQSEIRYNKNKNKKCIMYGAYAVQIQI